AFGRLHHQLDADEPLPAGEVREVHSRAGRDAELVLATAAVVLAPRFEPQDPGRLAARAAGAVRPAQALEIDAAPFPDAVLANVLPQHRIGRLSEGEPFQLGRRDGLPVYTGHSQSSRTERDSSSRSMKQSRPSVDSIWKRTRIAFAGELGGGLAASARAASA